MFVLGYITPRIEMRIRTAHMGEMHHLSRYLQSGLVTTASKESQHLYFHKHLQSYGFRVDFAGGWSHSVVVDKPSLTLRASQQCRSVGSCSLPVTCDLDKRHNSSGSNASFAFSIFQNESQSNNEKSRPDINQGLADFLSSPVSFARY